MPSRIFARLLNLPVDATQVILESLEMRYDKSRFCVVMLPLDEWEAKFLMWNDSLSTNDTDCMECWYRGFSQYARDESDDDDDGLGH